MQTFLYALVVAILVAGGLSAAEKTFRVEDFGAVTGDALDDTDGVRKAVAAAVQAGEPATVLFSPGVYRFRTASLGKNGRGVSVRAAKKLTIDGQGATLLFEGAVTPAFFEECQDLTLRNLTIDWERPPFSQGLVSAAGADWFEVQVDAEYPVTGNEPVYALMDYDRQSGDLIGDLDVYHSGLQTVALTGPQCLRFTLKLQMLKNRPDMQTHFQRVLGSLKGKGVVIRHGTEADVFSNYGLDFRGCSNTVIESVTLYAGYGLGFHDAMSDGIRCRKLRIVRKPGSGRVMSTLLDGWHASFMKGSILLEDCELDGMGDDGFNIYQKYLSVVGRAGQAILAKVAMRGWRGPTPAAGDRIEVRDPVTLRSSAVLPVKNAEWLAQHNLFRIEFAGEASAGIAENALLVNLAWEPADVRIQRCRFGPLRRSGILISTPNVTVENSLIEGVTHAGVMIFTDPWRQGSVAQAVTVRNNTFRNCGGAAIYSYAKGSAVDSKGAQYATVFQNIVVEGNRISRVGTLPALRTMSRENPTNMYWSAAILLGCADGVLVRGNTFDASYPTALYLHTLRNALVENNQAEILLPVRCPQRDVPALKIGENRNLQLVPDLRNEYRPFERYFSMLK